MLNILISRYPQLDSCKKEIALAVNKIIECYHKSGKLLLCGNGGSAADCEHISAALMKGFLKPRCLTERKKSEMKQNNNYIEASVLEKLQGGLPAIALPSLTALNSAMSNDIDPRLIYAQPLMALAGQNDMLVAISTSGNSENVCCAAEVAKALGMKVIALTGASGGRIKKISDISICVPERETFKVQELHLPVYHCICAMVENHFFEK